MTYATTFSGIGGWELGLNACGWELQWQCECEPFCQALLRERFGVPVYPDIRTLCDHDPAPVDALIGSPPCQPFSHAGQKRGEADERHLYPAFIGAIRRLRPRYVLMEQVADILVLDEGRAFGRYIGGLVALRYDLIWHCIPACAANAPIERDRLYIIAVSNEVDGKTRLGSQQNRKKARVEFCPGERIPLWLQAASQFARVGNGFSDQLYRHRVEGIGNAVPPPITYLIGQAVNQVETERGY